MKNQTNHLAHTKWLCKYHSASIAKYTTENECVKFHGILEEKERTDDVR